jgi:glycosyltransferase involved in cell wall biosynthesis
MNNPKVSVIIPCYNQGIYLKGAVDSVLKSDYNSFEIIIIDDGSTDEFTKRLLNQYNPSFTRIIHSENRGLAATRNLGISEANGEYILPLDADDKISNRYIQEAVKVFESNLKVGIVYAQAKMFGDKKGKWRLPLFSIEQLLASNIIFCSAFYRKKDWESIGGYNPHLPYGKEDWDFWLSLIARGVEVYQIPQVHFYYRIKPVSRDVLSNDPLKKEQINAKIYALHKKLYDSHLPNPLQLYQENMYLKHVHNRIEYRLLRKVLMPIYFFKKKLRIP